MYLDVDGLPYGWLREDPAFRASILSGTEPVSAAEEQTLRRQEQLEAALARMAAI
jgi:hypothetical protein